MSDRLETIKARYFVTTRQSDFGSFDMVWLIAEVERLRRMYDAMSASFTEADQEAKRLQAAVQAVRNLPRGSRLKGLLDAADQEFIDGYDAAMAKIVAVLDAALDGERDE